MKNILNQNFDNSDSMNNDELDINLILKFFFRNKLFIGTLTLVSFIIACFYSLKIKKTWEGGFQIVINDEGNSPSMNISPLLQSFSNIKTQKNTLKTEVEILGSPSVLMSTFDYVVSYKEKKYKKEFMNFSSWKNSTLDIDLEKNTSILNISYRDKDKELILPVLNKISSTYQQYSGRSKIRNQELTKIFLSNQIKLFKDKSSNALKAAQEFAIDQDLIYLDANNINSAMDNIEKTSSLLVPNISIENIRVQAANEIRRIDSQLEKINQIGNDFQKLQYIGSTIPALMEEGLPIELANIEKELVERRSKYTDDDVSILRIIDKRNLIIKLLKNRAVGYLQAKRIELEAQMEAAMRPKGTLLKYKELLREAGRDEATLISLENQLRAVELEDARLEDPWELITMPTLLEGAVLPSKKNIAFQGLLLGFFSSSLISFFKERKSRKIYNEDQINNILGVPLIEKFSLEDLKSNSDKFLYLKECIDYSIGKKIFLVLSKELENIFKDLYQDYLNDENNKVVFTNSIDNLKESSREDKVLLILSLESYKIEELELINKRVNAQGLNLVGFVLLDSELEK